MIAQWRASVMDRMRLIDRPEEDRSYASPVLIEDDMQPVDWLEAELFKIHMRELHAIQSLLTRALSKARESDKRIRSLQLAIGEISELDQASLQKHWDELSRNTLAEQAQLRFRLITAEVQCMACFSKYPPQNGIIHCPYCGSYGAKILSGEEFYLESIELDDE